jgi:hypothetical protein
MDMVSEALVRALDDARADRLALLAERFEDLGVSEAVFDVGEFPGEVVGVLDACIGTYKVMG